MKQVYNTNDEGVGGGGGGTGAKTSLCQTFKQNISSVVLFLFLLLRPAHLPPTPLIFF